MLATAVDPDLAWWWGGTLVAGVVVLAAVAVLLDVLVRRVREIHHGVDEAWVVAGQLAHHTSLTWVLDETANRMARLDRTLAAETTGEH